MNTSSILRIAAVAMAVGLGFGMTAHGEMASNSTPIPTTAVNESAVDRLRIYPNATDAALAAAVPAIPATKSVVPGQNPTNNAGYSTLTMDAAPAAPAIPSAIHGFAELDFRTDYITPRGLLVTNRGVTMQPVAGLDFDLYDGKGAINNISFNIGIWNDIDTSQSAASIGHWNEFDWFFGATTTVFKNFTLGAEYEEFDSPPHNFNTEHNVEFSAAFNDAPYWKKMNFPVSFHPYAKLFYAISGSSTVVTGKAGDTFDVEVGVVPTYIIPIRHLPITLTAPTWVTVGPSEYWGGNNNFGVFSTGLTATIPLKFIPAKFGAWHADVGVQYYHMINNRLVLASQLVGTGGHRDVVVGSAGIGFNF